MSPRSALVCVWRKMWKMYTSCARSQALKQFPTRIIRLACTTRVGSRLEIGKLETLRSNCELELPLEFRALVLGAFMMSDVWMYETCRARLLFAFQYMKRSHWKFQCWEKCYRCVNEWSRIFPQLRVSFAHSVNKWLKGSIFPNAERNSIFFEIRCYMRAHTYSHSAIEKCITIFFHRPFGYRRATQT